MVNIPPIKMVILRMGTIGFTTDQVQKQQKTIFAWDACELQTHWHEAEHSGQDIFPWKSMLVVPNVLPLLKRSRFDRKNLLYLRLFRLASSSIIWHLTQQFHHWYSFRNIWKHFKTCNHNNRGWSALRALSSWAICSLYSEQSLSRRLVAASGPAAPGPSPGHGGNG